MHYESRTVQEEMMSAQSTSKLNQSQNISRKSGTKTASLFAWVTLQSIPEETIISPHILEFLEQTLEPLPSKASSASGSLIILFYYFCLYCIYEYILKLLDDNEKDASDVAASYGQYVYASFPVDVIVYFHMQPSTFRFSCLPVSRVECMLQLPSLGIVFSSKRTQDE